MSVTTKLLGGMIKERGWWNFVMEDLLAGKYKTREKRNGKTHGPRKLRPPFSQFLY